MNWTLQALILACIAGVVAALTTHFSMPSVMRLAHRTGALDHPGGRKHHSHPIPRIGGVAVFLGLVAAALTGKIYFLVAGAGELAVPNRPIVLWSVAISTLLIFITGLVDDLRELSVLKKFFAQFVAAFIVVSSGALVEKISLPFLEAPLELSPLVAVGLSVIWIVGVTNAINLLDGMDGLAGGVVAIIASTFFLMAFLKAGSPTIIWIMAGLVGACFGFLRHNMRPAKIYLGDCGSLTLGFLLAVVSINLKVDATVTILVPILALGLPVIDTLLVMGWRFFQQPNSALLKKVKGMFKADRGHFHHLIQHLAPNRKGIVLFIYSLVLLFCSMALLVALMKESTGQILALGLVFLEFLMVLTLRHLGLSKAAKAAKVVQAKALQVGRESNLGKPSGTAKPMAEPS